ncbi:MAG: metal ABC transporter ATP-binding protein [Candidatus Kerfeldbacteria bacterium]|nr:metal ABC transporter ATP-binding protein [Candidatus Kerfeldbacteria bacterium]
MKRLNNHPAITFHDVSFEYGNTPVLSNVHFTIAQGEYVGVIGPNGGGKTTLVKLLLGLLQPDFGTIRLFGEPISPTTLRRVGYVPQRIDAEDIAFPATVQEIVESGRTVHRGLFHRLTREDQKKVQAALAEAEISHIANRRFGELSGGERQRVLIARALASEPRLLILDEPTAGVDVASQEQFYTFLSNLHTQHGLTILLVTHEIDVIANEAQSLLCVNRSITFHGSPKAFIRSDYLQELYGKNVKMILHHE